MKNADKQRAGVLGGYVRVLRHGNPGTPEGRKIGGLHSLETHRKKNTAFKMLKKIRKPRRSETLAELMGIMAGDGHLDLYQVSVTTNSKTDMEHAYHIQRIFFSLFAVHATITKVRGANAVTVLVSSKSVCDFLSSEGMVVGNKVVQQIAPPVWVMEQSKFKRAYIRGLVDADGCVYLDRHRIKEREYSSTCIAFTNASKPLLDFVEEVWKEEGFSPTRSGRDVRIRRKKNVLRYAQEIGFNNPKHANKIKV